MAQFITTPGNALGECVLLQIKTFDFLVLGTLVPSSGILPLEL